MADTGAVLAGDGTNNVSVGTTAWSNASNITLDDGSYATTPSATTATTRYLQAFDFGFDALIPSDATIDGVIVSIKRNTEDGSGVNDSSIRLVVGGSVVGDNKSTGAAWLWNPVDTTVDFGGSTDTWGLSLTAAEVRAADFGVVISATTLSDAAYVNAIWITVYYTGGSAGTLEFLQASTSTADASTYTFSAQNLGTADAERYIIVGVESRKSGATASISSITIGGVSATLSAQISNTITNTTLAGLAIAKVPTGTTGDIVVNFSATMLRCAVEAYRATNVTSLTAHDTGTSTASNPTTSLDIPTDGFAVGAAATGASTTTTWTGLTEDYDAVLESFLTTTSASETFLSGATGETITATFGSSTEPAGAFASWGFTAPAAGGQPIAKRTETVPFLGGSLRQGAF